MKRAPWYWFTAALFAVLYIAAKVQYAFEGRLGIYGGPQVTDAERALYQSSAQISQAQWANVVAGVLILACTLLPLIPATRRWRKWIVTTPALLVSAGLVVVGGMTIIGAIVNDAGGYLFGAYTVAWGALLMTASRAYLSGRWGSVRLWQSSVELSPKAAPDA